MKTEKYLCDVSGCEENVPEDLRSKKIQVIFTTEQTEGRSVKPYLSTETLDICEKCLGRILEGNYLFGNGAQGYNQYNFAKP